jgi:plasmid stability protein
MEEEAREILNAALAGKTAGHNLAETIRRRFEPLGGVNLPEVRRDSMREPPDFGR